MATEASMIQSVRNELGDFLESFRDTFRGTGNKDDWNLPANNVSELSSVYTLGSSDQIIPFNPAVDYTLNAREGIITFTTPPGVDQLVVVEGKANGILTDEEIEGFLYAAASQHLKDRTTEKRYRDGHGFIRYEREPMTMTDLPSHEVILVTLLATIEALWALSTDASKDIDVQTSEGTTVPRGQRWRQITAQIDILQQKYEKLSLAMGVGLFAPEVMTQTRVSRTTGRLIPRFTPREYDESGPPTRRLPPRNNRDEDQDGPPSPFWSGYGF